MFWLTSDSILLTVILSAMTLAPQTLQNLDTSVILVLQFLLIILNWVGWQMKLNIKQTFQNRGNNTLHTQTLRRL